MREIGRRAALLLLAALAAACGGPDDRPMEVTIAAAASLREACEETADAFRRERGGVRLVFSFDASSALARQLLAGAPYVAFLSADAQNVERAAPALDAETVTPFLSNALCIVTRQALADPPRSPEALADLRGKLALAGPEVPAGRYARAFLAERGLGDVLADRIVSAEHVRASLALVEAGAADAAIVYVTDARAARTARLAWTASPADDPGIRYVAAAVPPARDPGGHGRAYVAWLRGATFQAAAAARGFRPLTDDPAGR